MKYKVDFTNNFKKQYSKIERQGKNLDKLYYVINKLSNGEELEEKYKNHHLVNNKKYKNCMECHIEPDWLLIYRIDHNNLILVLSHTGSHSELFK